jgi:hypothetical protein
VHVRRTWTTLISPGDLKQGLTENKLDSGSARVDVGNRQQLGPPDAPTASAEP